MEVFLLLLYNCESIFFICHFTCVNVQVIWPIFACCLVRQDVKAFTSFIALKVLVQLVTGIVGGRERRRRRRRFLSYFVCPWQQTSSFASLPAAPATLESRPHVKLTQSKVCFHFGYVRLGLRRPLENATLCILASCGREENHYILDKSLMQNFVQCVYISN
jgi:hypothetical protein